MDQNAAILVDVNLFRKRGIVQKIQKRPEGLSKRR